MAEKKKVFVKGNYFIIDGDITGIVRYPAKSVYFTQDNPANDQFVFFFGTTLTQSSNTEVIDFADILDEGGVAYSDLPTFIAHLEENTSK